MSKPVFLQLALARSFIFALWLKAVNMWLSIADGKYAVLKKRKRGNFTFIMLLLTNLCYQSTSV